MESQPLQISNIELGTAQSTFDEELQKACQDIVLRPDNTKPRTVTLIVSIVPNVTEMQEGTADINLPKIDWEVKHSLPGNKGTVSKAFVEGGVVMVNVNDCNQPLQESLFEKKQGNNPDIKLTHIGGEK